MSGCTHDCNQGRNCTCQIAVAQPSRQTLQAEGKHPAPCARFCEAKAFEIEIRQLKAQIEALKADAERYRILKNSNNPIYTYAKDGLDDNDWFPAFGAELDAAIDAMKGKS